MLKPLIVTTALFLSSAHALTMEEFAGTYTQHSLFKNKRATDTLKIERINDSIAKVVFKTRGDENDGCQLEVVAELIKDQIVYIDAASPGNCVVVIAALGPNKAIAVIDANESCSNLPKYCQGKGENAIGIDTVFSYNSRTLPNGKSATRVEPHENEELCFGYTNPVSEDKKDPSVYVMVDKNVSEPKVSTFSLSVAFAEPKTEKIDFYMDLSTFNVDAKENSLKCTLSDDKSKVSLKNNQDGSVSLVRDGEVQLVEYLRAEGALGRTLRLNEKENESFKLYPTPCQN